MEENEYLSEEVRQFMENYEAPKAEDPGEGTAAVARDDDQLAELIARKVVEKLLETQEVQNAIYKL